MSAALVMVAVMVGTFFFWQAKKSLDEEIRGRALYLAKGLSALIGDDIITGSRLEIYKKITPPFIANEDVPSGSDLLYIMVYKHNSELLIGSSATEVFFNSDSYFYTIPSEHNIVRDEVSLGSESVQVKEPVFKIKKKGVYDLTFPIFAGSEKIGFIRLGLSGQRYATRFSALMKKALVALIVILFIGLAFSQIIAVSITKPILQLSDAAEKFSRQNWDSTLQFKGRDEISKLGQTFNRMALTLKQRELSLSRGNKDLFILHTAGLDMMESLDREALLVKIAARAEDLVRADTTAVAVTNTGGRMLKYIGVFGNKASVLKNMDMPLEAAGIYNWLTCYGTPLLIAEAQSDFRLDSALMRSHGIKCIMAVPLWSSNTMTGLLTAVNKKGGGCFDKHDLRLFTVFSNLVGAALQNASLYTDLMGKMHELRSAQEQLVHSTKMAAIGELAANVAHEVNNPLTSVLGYTTHLLKTLELPESSRRILTMMEQETLRVRKIIRNLLDFSRQKTSWMQPGDLLVPLKETSAFVKGAAESSSVALHEEYNGTPVIVNMDSNEMKQVFINIINNAMQAMPGGGQLWIRLKTVQGNEALVEFADTGVGIPQDNMRKIFEPFFSTKESGDGTGLGLSISYRIVQNHGGRIEVDSKHGTGTSFKVYLPLHKKPDAAEPSAHRGAGKS
jgi:signal transduction histidine kinase/HAMP domain-containing protein